MSRSLLAIVRSQAQIFFQAGWVTGLLILVAFAVVGPGMAASAVLGAVVQSGVSCLVPAVDRQEVVDGKHGFCGALTGAARRPPGLYLALRAGDLADAAARPLVGTVESGPGQERSRELTGQPVRVLPW